MTSRPSPLLAVLLARSGREVARVPVSEPVPFTVEHLGRPYDRSHICASGFAFIQRREPAKSAQCRQGEA